MLVHRWCGKRAQNISSTSKLFEKILKDRELLSKYLEDCDSLVPRAKYRESDGTFCAAVLGTKPGCSTELVVKIVLVLCPKPRLCCVE